MQRADRQVQRPKPNTVIHLSYCKYFRQQKTQENYSDLQVYNFTTYTPESKIRKRYRVKERERKREKERERKRKKEKEKKREKEREKGREKKGGIEQGREREEER